MAGSWVGRRFRTNEERNGKRKNHEADKQQPNNAEDLSEDAASIHMRLIGDCRPDAWVSCFALLSRYDAMGANIVTSSARYGRRLKMANVARFAPDVPVSHPETADADRSG
jgi:hypothetical protein